MASAKLEILISAKDAASQVMGRVKGAFALRAMEIQGLTQSLVKNGEKVEKFLHGISLLKMATETESFKTALSGVSPQVQKVTSDLLNMGVAIGGSLSLAKDLAHVLPAIGMKGAAALATTAGLYVVGKTVVDQMNEESAHRLKQGETGGPQLFNFYKRAGEVQRLDQVLELEMQAREASRQAILDGNQNLSEALTKFVNNLRENAKQIAAANTLRAERTARAVAYDESLKSYQAAQEEVRRILGARAASSPAGQMSRFNTASAQLAGWQSANINPETQPQLWLEQQKQIEALTAELKTLNEGPIGKWRDALSSLGGRAAALLRPSGRGTGDVTTTSLGTLPGSAILGDSMSRLGLFSGGGRSNPLTGLAEQKLTSIDSAAKEQIRILGKIWQTLTNGQTYQFGQ